MAKGRGAVARGIRPPYAGKMIEKKKKNIDAPEFIELSDKYDRSHKNRAVARRRSREWLLRRTKTPRPGRDRFPFGAEISIVFLGFFFPFR